MRNIFNKMIQLYKAGFRQEHEATCGPASIILATLGLGLEQKHESEWISTRFSRFMPVHQFLERGMALHELHFISELIYENRIDIRTQRAYEEHFSLFLNDVKESVQEKKSVIIVNYRQDDFVSNGVSCSQGNPHYSPIVGWDAKEDKVLLCDIDSSIQELYWVNIQTLYQSMSQYNPVFNLPRGWLVLKKRMKS